MERQMLSATKTTARLTVKKTARAKSNHYVDNKLLHSAMISYKKELRRAKRNNTLPPRVSPYVGECVMKIATHLAHKPNFAGYSFKDEMICDGIENCLQYIHNFDPKKSQNPFAYFTQIIFYAFLRRIQKEKKQLYTKHAAAQMSALTNTLSDIQEHDDPRGIARRDTSYGEWSQDQMLRFMEEFEASKSKRTKKIIVDTRLE
jgi:hypothetical protein